MSDEVLESLKHRYRFLHFAMERYKILLKRRFGEPPPWTTWPVLQEYSFCNVFREDDKTTMWFKDNIREPLRDDPKVLIATVAFRWFNRITTGERIKHVLLKEGWNGSKIRSILQGVNPIITGAFMVKSPPGKNKLEGLCDCIDAVAKDIPNILSMWRQVPKLSLEFAWRTLLGYPYLGNFMAYEVVTDLRHTHFLQDAPDILTWASPGPGCARGLGRVIDEDPKLYNYNSKQDRVEMICLMQHLLHFVNAEWPEHWPRWEMREVEHVLCEFDKYARGFEGGRLKRKYKPAG